MRLGRAGLALGGLLVCAATAGIAVSVLDGEDPPRAQGPAVDPALAQLQPRQLAGQRLVCGFQGTTLPGVLRQQLAAGELAGVILFERNIRSVGQARALTAELQAIERPAPLDAPLITAVDEEGGSVSRIPGAPRASAAAIGARGPGFARRRGAAVGELMVRAGLNVDLAPVLDVARKGGFIIRQRRSFGSRAGRVSVVGVAFAQGLRDAGVAATAKHFPGLGSTPDNTDLRPATIRLPAGRLRRVDEAPFVAFARAGGKLVMVSSARYPRLGAGVPASQSRATATTELRDRIGFEGVSITDALEGKGAQVTGPPRKVALRVARAEVDILLYGSCNTAVRAREALGRALRDGRLQRAPFEQSVARILALRAQLGR
ncbi:MAG: glycoside hydrolase family 3 N-terminal domain-containing protein [Solirubrobacterales bacterium]